MAVGYSANYTVKLVQYTGEEGDPPVPTVLVSAALPDGSAGYDYRCPIEDQPRVGDVLTLTLAPEA